LVLPVVPLGVWPPLHAKKKQVVVVIVIFLKYSVKCIYPWKNSRKKNLGVNFIRIAIEILI
jgi:hypothetical protein